MHSLNLEAAPNVFDRSARSAVLIVPPVPFARPINRGVRARGQHHTISCTIRIRPAAGDYYQLWLGPEESEDEVADPYEVKGPYLIVQRQLEMPDRGRCYIETHDKDYIGHFPLRLTEMSRTRLVFEIARKTNNHVEVSFAVEASEFEDVRRIAEIVFGLREPEPGDDDDAF
ncbi:MAG TPA: hypothetical protein VJH03_24540 [Blastocatellia bacterium]|nr:hypothetical protein [Blastocatellia bacterium]